MTKKKSDWTYKENSELKYYEAKVGDTLLHVIANKATPNIWLGIYGNHYIYDKTFNDRQRKKQGLLKECNLLELEMFSMLSNSDPNYMMRKVEHCFKTGKIEVCR